MRSMRMNAPTVAAVGISVEGNGAIGDDVAVADLVEIEMLGGDMLKRLRC